MRVFAIKKTETLNPISTMLRMCETLDSPRATLREYDGSMGDSGRVTLFYWVEDDGLATFMNALAALCDQDPHITLRVIA